MNRYYYVLRRDYIDLSIGELEALIKTYEPVKSIIKCYSSICIAEHENNTLYRVMNRASFIKRSGVAVSIGDPLSPKLDYINELSRYGVKWIKVIKYNPQYSDEVIKNYVDLLINKTGLNTEYRRGSYIEVFFIDNIVLIGYPLAYRRKYIDKRIYTRSIALPIELSRLLVNLTRVKEGDVILDPFMGTGSILIEANLMGIYGIGVDINYDLVKITQINLNNYSLNKYLLIHGDSRDLVYKGIDGITTNPPYGRGSRTKDVDIRELYESFINNALESLKKNRYIVFVTSNYLENIVDEILSRYSLRNVKKNYVYVHSSLTRVIYEVNYT